MLGKRLGHDQNTTSRPNPNCELQPIVRTGSEAAIELSQPRHCECAVSPRDVFARSIEVCGRAETRNYLAKVDDLGADR